MSTATLEAVAPHPVVEDWNDIHLEDIDPTFTAIPDDFYNLKISSAEKKSYDNTAKGGKAGASVKFIYTVIDHPTFTGRKVFPENMFINNFNLAVFRRIMDATGVQQGPLTFEAWLKELGSVGATLKLKVETVDAMKYRKLADGSGETYPDPYHQKPDGTPGKKTTINYKAGVQPAD